MSKKVVTVDRTALFKLLEYVLIAKRRDYSENCEKYGNNSVENHIYHSILQLVAETDFLEISLGCKGYKEKE